MRIFLFISAFFCLLSSPVFAKEGAGLLVSDLKGALPKALWRDQPRSEITYLLQNLPANARLRSMQEIKRNMLLSVYDTRLIDNDIETKLGEDLLTLRLGKLMKMGLWEDAFTLYTKTTEDPGENDDLARIGVLLILFQKGLPTACLEEKVFASRFPDTPFWQQIDTVCSAEIDGEKVISTQFADSSVLQAIYSKPDFTISANALKKSSLLELVLLQKKNKIDYQGIDLSENIAPHLLKIFLADPHFPKKHRESLEKAAIQKALLPESPLSEEELAQEEDPQNLTQSQLINLITHKLKLGRSISEKEVKKLKDLAPENPKNFVYIQLLKDIGAIGSDTPLSEDNFNLGLEAFLTPDVQKVNYLKRMLDKPSEFSNNPGKVYEKQRGLTPDGGYVMPTDGLTEWLKKTQDHKFAGLSLLIVLSNNELDAYAKNSGDIPEDKTFNMLKSLSAVGLIEQARHIAREKLANMMGLDN